MFKNDTFLAVSAIFASTSSANRLVASYGVDRESSLSLAQIGKKARGLQEAAAGLEDYCCTVFNKPDKHVLETYCLLDHTSQVQSVHSLRMSAAEHTYRCGVKVDAQLCLQGHSLTQEDGNDVYECQGQDVIELGARQEIEVQVQPKKESTILIQYHPWVAKGPGYLELPRQEKDRILWDKVTEDPTQGPIQRLDLDDFNKVFDEWGDEYDCRFKAAHGQGNVGKVQWISNDKHQYTGMFRGGDTGYIRTSDTLMVFANPSPVGFNMVPSIGLKLLRDGMDSANTFGQYNARQGIKSLNWFDAELTSIIQQHPTTMIEGLKNASLTSKQATNFVGAVGHLEMASYEQDGSPVAQPVYPFMLKYMPTGEFEFPRYTYDRTVYEYLQDIPVDSVLYTVWALAQPEELGGQWQEIGEIVTKTKLVTSFWGDKKMKFRHSRFDDDLGHHPEWIPYGYGWDVVEGPQDYPELRPSQGKKEPQCPFAWLLDQLQQ